MRGEPSLVSFSASPFKIFVQERPDHRRFRCEHLVRRALKYHLTAARACACYRHTHVSLVLSRAKPPGLLRRCGKSGMIVSDHGTEFTSNAILAWSKDHKVE